jgi:hypothetical protein
MFYAVAMQQAYVWMAKQMQRLLEKLCCGHVYTSDTAPYRGMATYEAHWACTLHCGGQQG